MSTETDNEIVKKLRTRWDDLTSFVLKSVKEKWWDRIYSHYSSRPFHNLKQLHAQMELFDESKDNLRDRYAVAFAIFFKHLECNTNLVNDSRKSEIEHNVQLLHEFSSETTFDQESYVANLLTQSAKNCTEAHMKVDEFGTEDIHYLIDFDTAWLGAKPNDYDHYSTQIRHEFEHISDSEYRTQRLKVLQLFLQVPNIFATLHFRERFEKAARSNIQREIDSLRRC